MKFIKLLTAAHVGGILRHPHEGVLHIDDEEAQRLLDDKAGEDVSDDFTAKQDRETPVEAVTTVAAQTDAPAGSEPHQSEVAPAASDDQPKPGRKAATSKE